MNTPSQSATADISGKPLACLAIELNGSQRLQDQLGVKVTVADTQALEAYKAAAVHRCGLFGRVARRIGIPTCAVICATVGALQLGPAGLLFGFLPFGLIAFQMMLLVFPDRRTTQVLARLCFDVADLGLTSLHEHVIASLGRSWKPTAIHNLGHELPGSTLNLALEMQKRFRGDGVQLEVIVDEFFERGRVRDSVLVARAGPEMMVLFTQPLKGS